MATPNGQKVTIALEEMGFKYDAWYTNIMSVRRYLVVHVVVLGLSFFSTDGVHESESRDKLGEKTGGQRRPA